MWGLYSLLLSLRSIYFLQKSFQLSFQWKIIRRKKKMFKKKTKQNTNGYLNMNKDVSINFKLYQVLARKTDIFFFLFKFLFFIFKERQNNLSLMQIFCLLLVVLQCDLKEGEKRRYLKKKERKKKKMKKIEKKRKGWRRKKERGKYEERKETKWRKMKNKKKKKNYKKPAQYSN